MKIFGFSTCCLKRMARDAVAPLLTPPGIAVIVIFTLLYLYRKNKAVKAVEEKKSK